MAFFGLIKKIGVFFMAFFWRFYFGRFFFIFRRFFWAFFLGVFWAFFSKNKKNAFLTTIGLSEAISTPKLCVLKIQYLTLFIKDFPSLARPAFLAESERLCCVCVKPSVLRRFVC